MRIDTIKIQNFRGIVEAEYDLHPHVTVLLGNNAKGKSATLDALAMLVCNHYLWGVDGVSLQPIQNKDIRQELHIQRDGSARTISYLPCVLKASAEVRGNTKHWELIRNSFNNKNKRREKTSIYGDRGSYYESEDFFNEEDSKEVTHPFLGYYSVARLSAQKQNHTKQKIELPNRKTAYVDALTQANSQWKAERWFAGLQSRAYGGLGEAKAIFEMAKSKILALFQSVEPPLKDIRHDPEIDVLFVLFENAEGFIPVSFLSSGYKSVLSMGLDIVYRIYILNPHLGAKAFDETPGIALIDEIDMHLHPKWQGHIIDDLRKAFPLLQFVVSTHSAFIVQGLRDARIIDLDNERERDIGDYVKKSIPEIAEEYMGMEDLERSPYFNAQVKAAEEYFTLLKSTPPSDPEKLAQAKAELDKYEIRYDRDPAFIGLLRVERKAAGME